MLSIILTSALYISSLEHITYVQSFATQYNKLYIKPCTVNIVYTIKQTPYTLYSKNYKLNSGYLLCNTDLTHFTVFTVLTTDNKYSTVCTLYSTDYTHSTVFTLYSTYYTHSTVCTLYSTYCTACTLYIITDYTHCTVFTLYHTDYTQHTVCTLCSTDPT